MRIRVRKRVRDRLDFFDNARLQRVLRVVCARGSSAHKWARRCVSGAGIVCSSVFYDLSCIAQSAFDISASLV